MDETATVTVRNTTLPTVDTAGVPLNETSLPAGLRRDWTLSLWEDQISLIGRHQPSLDPVQRLAVAYRTARHPSSPSRRPRRRLMLDGHEVTIRIGADDGDEYSRTRPITITRRADGVYLVLRAQGPAGRDGGLYADRYEPDHNLWEWNLPLVACGIDAGRPDMRLILKAAGRYLHGERLQPAGHRYGIGSCMDPGIIRETGGGPVTPAGMVTVRPGEWATPGESR